MKSFICTTKVYKEFLKTCNDYSFNTTIKELIKDIPEDCRFVVFEGGNFYDPTFYWNLEDVELNDEE